MAGLAEDDRKFIEKVIDSNSEGLKRLAREEHAAARRDSELERAVRELYRGVRRLVGLEDDKASFTRIEG